MIEPLIIRTLVNVTVPAIYSDALSYQDMIAILQGKINECIKALNGLTSAEIEAVISAYLTPEKIQEIIEGGFGDYVDEKLDTALSDYWDSDTTAEKISDATDSMTVAMQAYVPTQTAPLATAITTLSSDLANNYDTSSEVDDKIAAATSDLTDYYTKDETDTEIGIAVNEEATLRDSAISTAITANNAQYYKKSEIDTKDAGLRTYTDTAVEALRDDISASLAFIDWSSVNANFPEWNTSCGNPHSILSQYDAIISDVSDVLMEFRGDQVDNGTGEISLGGQLRITTGNTSSGASISPGDTTALMLVYFPVRADIHLMVDIINTAGTLTQDNTLLRVPMVLHRVNNTHSVLLYKNVNTDITPSFTIANKRLYFHVTGYYEIV